MTTSKTYPMPFTRVQLCVLRLTDNGLEVLLVRRQEAPEKGKWALPGGVLRIDLDDSLEAAAQRIAGERLASHLPYLRLQAVGGGKDKDPRSPWTLSITYRAMTHAQDMQPQPGKRIEALKWMAVDDAGADANLAFDHASITRTAAETLRREVQNLELPIELLPDGFTLGELQRFCELILGRPLDKSSFRRRLDDKGCVEPVRGEFRGAAHRPAQVYRAVR